RQGSRFILRLAANVAPAGEEPAPVTPQPVTPGDSGLVLVIDDDVDIQEMLRRTLSRYGFSVQGARNGEEGIRLARKLRPQAITLDVMMPGMDGWTVLSQLKSDPELADIPVVLLTIVDNKNLGYALGAAEYL